MIWETRSRILQGWIRATIYNDESSKYGSCVAEHIIILSNLGYKGEPKVFVEIKRKRYNIYHVNRCDEVELEKNSTGFQTISESGN